MLRKLGEEIWYTVDGVAVHLSKAARQACEESPELKESERVRIATIHSSEIIRGTVPTKPF